MSDNKHKEIKENEILTNSGFYFKAGRLKFEVKPLTLGVQDHISTELLKMTLNEKAIESDPLGQLKFIIKDNVTPCVRAIAKAALGKRCRIPFAVWALSAYLKWHLTPKQMFSIFIQIIKQADMENFTNSIRLIAGMTTTSPNRVEKN